MTLGQGQEYSCSFIYLFSYLHLQIFKSQVGMVSEKYTVLTFSHTKAYGTKVDLGLK